MPDHDGCRRETGPAPGKLSLANDVIPSPLESTGFAVIPDREQVPDIIRPKLNLSSVAPQKRSSIGSWEANRQLLLRLLDEPNIDGERHGLANVFAAEP